MISATLSNPNPSKALWHTSPRRPVPSPLGCSLTPATRSGHPRRFPPSATTQNDPKPHRKLRPSGPGALEPALGSRTAFPHTRPQNPPQAQAQAQALALALGLALAWPGPAAPHSSGPSGPTAAPTPQMAAYCALSQPRDRRQTGAARRGYPYRADGGGCCSGLGGRRTGPLRHQPRACVLHSRASSQGPSSRPDTRAARGSDCLRQCLNNQGPTSALPHAESLHKILPTGQSAENRDSVIIPLFQAERSGCKLSGTARAAPLGLRMVAVAASAASRDGGGRRWRSGGLRAVHGARPRPHRAVRAGGRLQPAVRGGGAGRAV